MTYSIGLAGKGGTGKTTLAGLCVKYLVEQGKTPVLAVDADANANFNEVLGLEVKETLGDAREEMKKGGLPGMTKDIYMEMKLEQAVVEAKGFDLIVMGRPEGSGCYCAANTLLTQYLDRLIHNYATVVIDNEAGMEHISRMTTNNIDLLLVVSDTSRRGILSAARIFELTDSLPIKVGRKALVINQARENQVGSVEKTVLEYGLPLEGILPEDEEIQQFDLQGRPTIDLGPENRVLKAAYAVFEKVLKNGSPAY